MDFDVIIIGAGAAGLMCAIEAGKRGRRVLVVDHANKVGKKILMSGGGRCNFTNYYIEPNKYLSNNPHFVKSALKRYTQWDFIQWVEQHRIAYHEKTLGQLFCDGKAKAIVNMLLSECESAGVTIQLNSPVADIKALNPGFSLKISQQALNCESLVIATGGLSIPTMGATSFGYKVAKQFGLQVWPTRAGLVPFTLNGESLQLAESLSGVAVAAEVSNAQQNFSENILFTHRGLSGPACLQLSSYWQQQEAIVVNLLPKLNLAQHIIQQRTGQLKIRLKKSLLELIPKRLIEALIPETLLNKNIQELSKNQIQQLADSVHRWQLTPRGTEGYRTAEVTLGGVDTRQLSSQTMQAQNQPGLFFIGEVVDVTGWLGGYNFQWAWSSGWVAGQVV